MENKLMHMGSQSLILILITLLSIASLSIFIERLRTLKKSERDIHALLMKIREALHLGNIMEAVHICEETGGPIANMLRGSIGKHAKSKEHIESVMEMVGSQEIASLEKNTKVLSVVAHICPMIGLLGTVLGFMQAFAEMRKIGLVDISTTTLGEAMELALITTAAGLAVAIPSFIAYNYIVSRVEAFVLEMNLASHEILELLMELKSE